MTPSVLYVSYGPMSGYATAGRRMLLALDGYGVDVCWTPAVFDPFNPLDLNASAVDPALAPLRTIRSEPDVLVCHTLPEHIPLLEHLRPPGGAMIAHTVWEAWQVQDHWPELLNLCDGVIVPTEWNAAAFRAADVSVPIGVVPHVAPTDVPDHSWLGPGELDLGSRFVVHCIATWSARKQPWLVVEAFARAFGHDDDAVLVMRTDATLEAGLVGPAGPPDKERLSSWTVATILHRHHPCGEVRLVHHVVTGAKIAALHERSDCWLSLPHSEGWDLGAFDAALAGTPVITTAYGGPLEYLDPASPLLVPGAEAAMPVLAHLSDGTWMDPDLDFAVRALQSVAQDSAEARTAAESHAASMRATFDPDAVARRFLDVLASMGVT